ncbi:MAG: CRISPR-associated helicase Cas3' [Lachnospiraceae bacterium]|nr:CRISPR-associated helicase Cas3' [Lachnospiraceae bacterium]
MIAHIRETDSAEQTVIEHSKNVAEKCARYLDKIGLKNTGVFTGLMHDAGKLCEDFQGYIRNTLDFKRGDIDHSFPGAKFVFESVLDQTNNRRPYEFLLPHAIISHHGLHDWVTEDNQNYFANRIEKNERYEEVRHNIEVLYGEKEIDCLSRATMDELKEIDSKLVISLVDMDKASSEIKKVRYGFYYGLLERMIQSALIDADRIDTADFMDGVSSECKYKSSEIFSGMIEKMNRKCSEFEKRNDIISKRRCDISNRCYDFAKNNVGICRLVVPTGGGKTYSSLRFAIEECRRYGKERIIYVAPYMSILEQNSDAIKEIVGEDFFLEHYSDVVNGIEDDEELEEYELRTERWDIPVIATTMVQFLNTLFSGKSSSVRRFHRLSNSVIIVDEIQSLPIKCVNMFNLAMNFIAKICNSTVVLCTATQPALDKTEYALLLDSEESITGDYTEDFEVFKRTEVISEANSDGMSYEEATRFCIEKYRKNGNILIITNTKKAAASLFDAISKEKTGAEVYYLTTNLCPQHRRKILEKIREDLSSDNEKPVICVTTPLIEAGVDISFKCVVRSLTGLDSVAQAAGRCNRNGEYNHPCPVYMIKLKEEATRGLDGLKDKQNISLQIVTTQREKDYTSVEIQKKYSLALFRNNADKMSYNTKDCMTPTSLVEMLSLNRIRYGMLSKEKNNTNNINIFTSQAFKTAGMLFKVIEDNTTDIIVPYDEQAENLIEMLDSEMSNSDMLKIERKAQRYVTGIYQDCYKKLDSNNAIRKLRNGSLALEKRFYSSEKGIVTEGCDMELLVF